MRTREEIMDDLIEDLRGAKFSWTRHRAYTARILEVLLDIRTLLASDSKE